MLFKRTRKPRKHNRPSQNSASRLASAAAANYTGTMAVRDTGEPVLTTAVPVSSGRHAGRSAPLAGEILASRYYPSTDSTALMPAAVSVPPSMMPASVDLREAQARALAVLPSMLREPVPPRTRADGPWFRPMPGSDTTANDLSLAAFQRKWAQRAAGDVVLNPGASPKTLVMTVVGFGSFEGASK